MDFSDRLAALVGGADRGDVIAATPVLRIGETGVVRGQLDRHRGHRLRVPDVETLRDVVLVQLHGLPEVRSTQTVFVLEDHLPLRVQPPPG